MTKLKGSTTKAEKENKVKTKAICHIFKLRFKSRFLNSGSGFPLLFQAQNIPTSFLSFSGKYYSGTFII
jgi:hypothetical protein